MNAWPVIERFFYELQRRKVLRVASAYIVAGWIVLQVAATIENTLNLPASFDTMVFGILAAALPIVLGLSWVYEITPQGIKRTETAGDGTLVMPETTDLLLAGMLLLVGLIAVGQMFLSESAAPPVSVVEAPKPAQPAPIVPAVDPKSIAVLPFINMSTDKENEYFSDGLTEELLNLLAQLPELKVISRTSSFSFKGQTVPLPDIARQLGVRHILEGSVRRSGSEVRITAQLIDVSRDVHLWSRTYDRKIDSIFAVQDEIATAIASSLDIELALIEPRNAPTKNMEAYRLFLEGREAFRKRDGSAVRESMSLFQRAIALDKKFAQAYAGLAAAYTSEGSRSGKNFSDFGAKAAEAAREAMKLDPKLAQPAAVLGSLACDRLQWNTAFEEGLKAVELDRSDSTAHLWLGLTQYAVGKLDDAALTLNRAAQVDPLYTFIHLWRIRVAFARRDDAAGVKIAERLLGAGPEITANARLYLAAVAKERGDAAEAERQFRAALGGEYPEILEPIVAAIKSPAAMPAARKVLDDEARRDPTFNPDMVYFLIGDTDGFLDLVARRLAEGDTTRVAHMIGLAWRIPKWSQTEKGSALLKAAGIVDYWRSKGAPSQCSGQGLEHYVCD